MLVIKQYTSTGLPVKLDDDPVFFPDRVVRVTAETKHRTNVENLSKRLHRTVCSLDPCPEDITKNEITQDDRYYPRGFKMGFMMKPTIFNERMASASRNLHHAANKHLKLQNMAMASATVTLMTCDSLPPHVARAPPTAHYLYRKVE
ncbi:hypothetical protein MLD38_009613 [Melastoma candidum]|uniref:Uncharacterized protein n=1 Tax=Melastoma candidum TaxID=119954 RepID=A0ACB9S011_9MYRT|nr:hypothetical protein MLD38_009613 [Melastoma candidum]